MNSRTVRTMLVIGLLFTMLDANAGYWRSSAGEIVRNNFGECWHTGFWVSDDAVVGCDGKQADATPPPVEATPVAMPTPAPAPANATVNFAFDRADLDGDARSAIDTLVSDARSRGSIQSARLTGHADRIGTEGYNQDLSLRRASSVSDYLVGNAGVDAQAVEIGGRGESEPLVGCEGERGSALIRCLAPNRRVEIILDVMGQ